MCAKPLRISFDKIDGIIKIYDKIISEESGITDSINHNFARIRIDLYNSLPIEKNIDFL